ncbi:hypothetical protein NUW58_g921 [Xylaria curta]|uniref:Uncharacterized protein n=1 Tax=Xylaria curta TaxID=42375 RepID=A0ACC1PME2_9PEZI|nr:hypothetical protein NUW58_g921 [Xylaria curta]
MVQITNFVATIAVAFSSAGLVSAKSCNNGGIYCGDYINKIITNLRANGLGTDDYTIKNSLWACIEHGDIQFKEFCDVGCVGGDKNDDYCSATGHSKKRGDEGVAWVA